MNKSNLPNMVCFLLICKSGLSVAGCNPQDGAEIDAGTDTDTDSDTDSDTDADSDADSDSDTDVDTDTDSEYGDDDDICVWMCEEIHVIDSPPPGTPANLGVICDEPSAAVESNLAAKVLLNIYSGTAYLAKGAIEIPSDLREAMVADPLLKVIEADPQDLYSLEISDLEPSKTGYTFNAKWPESFSGGGSMIVEATLELSCDERINVEGGTEDGGIEDGGIVDGGSASRVVTAVSFFEWCSLDCQYYDPEECYENRDWATSGEMCYFCWCDPIA